MTQRSKRVAFGDHKRLLVPVMAVVLTCAGCAVNPRFEDLNAPVHSVRLETRGDRFLVISESWAPGPGSPVPVSFDAATEIARHGSFVLLSNSRKSSSDEVDQQATCLAQFPEKDFQKAFGRFAAMLNAHPFQMVVNLVFATAPAGRGYSQSEQVAITDTLTVRLVFQTRTLQETCDAWWLDLFGTYIHELTHLSRRLHGLAAPNILTEEVIASSAARCAQLEVSPPSELTMTSFRGIPSGNKEFSALYEGLSRHLSENPDFSGNASMRGKILADFHFFRMLDYSYIAPISRESRRQVDQYCAAIIESSVDFEQADYFAASESK